MPIALRDGRTLADLTAEVDVLEQKVQNFQAYDTGPSREGLRSEYRSFITIAERVVHDYLVGVEPARFGTDRYRMILEATIQPTNIWQEADADAKQHLRWFHDVLDELARNEDPGTPTPGRPRLVRQEVWEAAGTHWNSGHVEEAVFAAFRKVEAIVQDRTKSQRIGAALFKEAFDADTPAILISKESRDNLSLQKLFDGSVGLFKGDRSHGHGPAIPIGEDKEYGLRLLAIASALLDLLDRDTNCPPSGASSAASLSLDEQRSVLLQERPDFWEYELFANRLTASLERWQDRYSGFQLRLVQPSPVKYDLPELTAKLGSHDDKAITLAGNIDRLFDQDFVQRAFGPPGVAGDAALIEFLAERIGDIYAEMLAWSEEVRSINTTDECQRLVALHSQLLDEPIQQIRDYVALWQTTVADLPRLAEAALTSDEPLTIVMELALTIDDNVMAEMRAEMTRLQKRKKKR